MANENTTDIQSETTSANSVIVPVPEPGQRQTVTLEAGQIPQINFDPGTESTQDFVGADLVFTFDNGAVLVFEDFAADINDGEVSAIMLADGSIIPVDVLMTAWNLEVPETAAGAAPVSGGGSRYVDDMGDALTGIDKLGVQDPDPFGAATLLAVEDEQTPIVLDVGVEGIEIANVVVNEGEDAVFNVSISGAAAGSTVNLTLADGTAIDADYNEAYFEYSSDGGTTWTAVTGAIGVAAGDSSLLVRTDTFDDTLDEPDETFTLNATLTSQGTDYADSATATIIDNDIPVIDVSEIETANVVVNEGDDAVFNVSISGAAAGSTVTLTLADGTAIDADYNEAYFEYSSDGGTTWTAVTGAIGVAAGDSSLLVRTDTFDDTLNEPDETFTLSATLTSQGTDYADSATATIIDNDIPVIDAAVSFAIASTPSISEEGAETATFTVSMNGTLPTGETASVVIDLDGASTATGSLDYAPAFEAAIVATALNETGLSYDESTNTLTVDSTFDGSFSFDVAALDDNLVEGTETIIANLSNATVSNGTATITTDTTTTNITESDADITAYDSEVTVNEAALDQNPLPDGNDLAVGTVTGSLPGSTAETTSNTIPAADGGTPPLTYDLISSPTGTYGTIQVNTNGTYHYTLTSPVNGPTANDGANTIVDADTFTYMVTDTNGNTTTAQINVNIIDDVPSIESIQNGVLDNVAGLAITGHIVATPGADGIDSYQLDPSAITEPSGLSYTYSAGSTLLVAQDALGEDVFTLHVNTNGTYDFTLIKATPEVSVETESFASLEIPNHATSYTTDLYNESGDPFGTVTFKVANISTQELFVSADGLGINNNLMNTDTNDPEILFMDFDTLVSDATFEIGNFTPGDVLKWTVYNESGGVLDTGTITNSFFDTSGNVVTISNAASINYSINLAANGLDNDLAFSSMSIEATTDAYKFTGFSVEKALTIDDQDYAFNVVAVDGDGDVSAHAEFTITVDGEGDTLSGSAFGDMLLGGDDSNILFGDLGSDTLTGGDGADIFAFTGSVNEGSDTITDFDLDEDTLSFYDVLDGGGDVDLDGVNDNLDVDSITISISGDDVTLTTDSGTQITLEGVNIGGAFTGFDNLGDFLADDPTAINVITNPDNFSS